MANTLEKRGLFWWFNPGHANTASVGAGVPGALTVTEQGHVQLQLDGPLWFENPKVSFEWDSSRWLPQETRIEGQIEDEDDTRHVLLMNLIRTDFSFLDDQPARQSYEADFCFTSDFPFPPDFDPETFHALRIELTGLEEWLQLDSIQIDPEFRRGDRTEANISYKHHEFIYSTPTAKVTIENQVLGLPLFFFSKERPVRKVDIHQIDWLIHTPIEQQSFEEIRVDFQRIEGLLTLLVGTYFRLEWPYFVGKRDDTESWYKLYWFRGPQREKLPWSVFLWTKFPSLQAIFGSLLVHWQAITEKNGTSCGLYIASLQTPLPQPEHEFVNLVWAVESLHRNRQREAGESPEITRRKGRIEGVLNRFSDPGDRKLQQWLEGKLRYAYEPSLEDRIVDSFSRLPLGINAAQLRLFAQRCASRRNDISHEGGARGGEDVEAFRADIRDLANALRYLLHCLLLHEVGLPAEVLLKAMTSSSLALRVIMPALSRVQIDLTAQS